VSEATELDLNQLPLYEWRLLQALAFFRYNRDVNTQALHCLCMYLRQSEGRVMSEVSFYAKRLNMTADELLDLIDSEPERASDLLKDLNNRE
jgi:hypothetical protein